MYKVIRKKLSPFNKDVSNKILIINFLHIPSLSSAYRISLTRRVFCLLTGMWGGQSPGGGSSSSSWRSGSPSPSPPLSEEGSSYWSRQTPPPSGCSDEGIALDYDELPRKKKVSEY